MLNRTLLTILAGVALALPACGDDDEDSGPTKAEFITQADSICQEGEERAQQIARAGLDDPENPTGPEVLAIVKELIPVQRDTVEQVRALEKPEGDEDEINEFLDKAEAATDEVEQIEDPQVALETVQASDTPDDPFYEANQAAKDYGLVTCAD